MSNATDEARKLWKEHNAEKPNMSNATDEAGKLWKEHNAVRCECGRVVNPAIVVMDGHSRCLGDSCVLTKYDGFQVDDIINGYVKELWGSIEDELSE